jgi:hypothetical protein
MTKDHIRAEARFNRASGTKAAATERDIAAKAVLDNMARLKALRLAREASEPPRPVTARNARSTAKKPAEKGPALADWLASQRGGGRRT